MKHLKKIPLLLLSLLLIFANNLLIAQETKAPTKNNTQEFKINNFKNFAKAQEGLPAEQYILALELLKINKKTEAQVYFLKAAAQGHVTAKMYLALLTINGLSEDENQLNVELFKNLALFSLNNLQAQSLNYETKLMGFYLEAKTENLQEALMYLNSATKLNNRDASFALGLINYYGLAEIEKNNKEGLKLISKAAEKGHYEAIDFLQKIKEENKLIKNKKAESKKAENKKEEKKINPKP